MNVQIDYCITFGAFPIEWKVLFVTEREDAGTIARFVQYITSHSATPAQVSSLSINMSPAFIKSVTENLSGARITCDRCPFVADASAAVDRMLLAEALTDPNLKGLRWFVLKVRNKPSDADGTVLGALIAGAATKCTARTWLYRESFRDLLDRK